MFDLNEFKAKADELHALVEMFQAEVGARGYLEDFDVYSDIFADRPTNYSIDASLSYEAPHQHYTLIVNIDLEGVNIYREIHDDLHHLRLAEAANIVREWLAKP